MLVWLNQCMAQLQATTYAIDVAVRKVIEVGCRRDGNVGYRTPEQCLADIVRILDDFLSWLAHSLGQKQVS